MITVTYGDKSKVELDRSKLLHLFPESLLAQALHGDPEAKEIHLENPLVTPEVMKCLQGLLAGELPPVENKILAKVGDYLNIPMLNLVSREDYPEILKTCNYRDKKWKYDRLPYKRYIGAGRRLDHVELFQYGLRLMPEDAPLEYLSFLKEKVFIENNLNITQALLQDSRFPVNYEDIKSLLYYCKWHWREYSDHPLETKYVPNYEETIQLMISHLPTLDGLDQLLDTFKEEYNMRPLCEVLRAHSQ